VNFSLILALIVACACYRLGEGVAYKLVKPRQNLQLGRRGSKNTALTVGFPVRQIGQHRYELDTDDSLADTLDVIVQALRLEGEG
jgi:hypothetical protein